MGLWNTTRLNAWIHKKVGDPLLQILRRGAEPKQLAFSAALGISLGVFPICGAVSCQLIFFGFAHEHSKRTIVLVIACNLMWGDLRVNSLVLPFLRLGERISGGPHFALTSDALKKVLTGQASREVLSSISNALLGWFITTPFLMVALYILFLPCFKILVCKFSDVAPSPNIPTDMDSEVKPKPREYTTGQ